MVSVGEDRSVLRLYSMRLPMRSPPKEMDAMERLRRGGISVGDEVRVRNGAGEMKGILLPHHDFSRRDVFTIKLSSGYNTGIRYDDNTQVEKIASAPVPEPHASAQRRGSSSGKRVAFIGTGGTIASYVDYRTGGVFPAYDADGIVSLVPEISGICSLEGRNLFSEMSENFGHREWSSLAEEVASRLNAGYNGVLISHGTDTMSYTAAALSFMLHDLTGPVVLVGAQRSPDRPSFDGYLNLLCASRVAAESDIGEVVVVMHSNSSDGGCTIHRGTKVRKMHSSRRDAFRSINAQPIGFVNGGVRCTSAYRKASPGTVTAETSMSKEVVLVQFYPDMGKKDFLDLTEGKRGVVIAGTGLGHVSSELVKSITMRVSENVAVVATTQCLNGTTDLNVYSTGRDMLKAGVIPGGDMLPEVAYVKLRYVLAHHRSNDSIRHAMMSNLAGELTDRREGTVDAE